MCDNIGLTHKEEEVGDAATDTGAGIQEGE